MSDYNRLTNQVCERLANLPVWTTAADRRRALSYQDRDLVGAAISAAETMEAGRAAPEGFGLLLAVARLEKGGWIPDGGFNVWRRQGFFEGRTVEELVAWIETAEKAQRDNLAKRENARLAEYQRRTQDVAIATAQLVVTLKPLEELYQSLVHARISIGDLRGADEIIARICWRSGRAPCATRGHQGTAYGGS